MCAEYKRLSNRFRLQPQNDNTVFAEVTQSSGRAVICLGNATFATFPRKAYKQADHCDWQSTKVYRWHISPSQELRSTTAAQVHHLIRYGREKGPDVMDSVQYRYLIVLVLKKKKSISCFHQSQSWLLVKKPPCYFILCSFDEDECICAPPHLTLPVRVH